MDEFQRLIAAAVNLYRSGQWVCPELPEDEQFALWEELGLALQALGEEVDV
jgi:hypothetical protein